MEIMCRSGAIKPVVFSYAIGEIQPRPDLLSYVGYRINEHIL